MYYRIQRCSEEGRPTGLYLRREPMQGGGYRSVWVEPDMAHGWPNRHQAEQLAADLTDHAVSKGYPCRFRAVEVTDDPRDPALIEPETDRLPPKQKRFGEVPIILTGHSRKTFRDLGFAWLFPKFGKPEDLFTAGVNMTREEVLLLLEIPRRAEDPPREIWNLLAAQSSLASQWLRAMGSNFVDDEILKDFERDTATRWDFVAIRALLWGLMQQARGTTVFKEDDYNALKAEYLVFREDLP